MAQITDEDLFLASVLVKDAVHGRDFPFRDDSTSLWWYKLYNNGMTKFLNNAAVLFLLGLAFFEDPVSCDPQRCRLPLWGIMVWETFCLLAILFHLFNRYKFCGLQAFIGDVKNLISIGTVLICFADLIVFAFFYPSIPLTGPYPQRFSPMLRPLFVINATENRRIRRVVRCIRALIKDVIPIFILFFLIVSVFALIFFKIFSLQDLRYYDSHSPPSPYFKDYFDTFWDLFIYVTTVNSPDVMQPAYDQSAWYSLLFVVFQALTLWGVMPIILAITYNNYLRYLKEQIKINIHQKRSKLKRAFHLLSTSQENDSEKAVSLETWDRLAVLLLEDKSSFFRKLIFKVLDTTETQSLTLSEFLYLSDLLNIDIRPVESKVHVIEKFLPRLYTTPVSQFIRRAVLHPFFTYFFDILIITNAVVLAVCSKDVVSASEWIFLVFFTIEILLKVYTVGPLAFIRKNWNIFDLLLVVLAWAAAIAEKISPEVSEIEVFYDLVITVRVLRVFRIVYSIRQFVVIVNTVHHILPSILAIVILLLCVYYMFAIFGMMLFAGIIKDDMKENEPDWETCGNSALKGTAFAAAHYCKNSFNSLSLSFIVLFDLTVVNNWHYIAEAYVLATSKAARLYFIVFYFVVIIIMMNIFVAFVLEAFLLQYKMFRGEQKESRLRLHVSKFLDAISGRTRIIDTSNSNVNSFINRTFQTQTDERTENVHIEWTVGDGLATISITGPAAQEVNVGFVMRNTYKNADTLLETMLFDEQQVREAECTNEAETDDVRNRAGTSVWHRSDLSDHKIYQKPTVSADVVSESS